MNRVAAGAVPSGDEEENRVTRRHDQSIPSRGRQRWARRWVGEREALSARKALLGLGGRRGRVGGGIGEEIDSREIWAFDRNRDGRCGISGVLHLDVCEVVS